jgi:hypothetical protein
VKKGKRERTEAILYGTFHGRWNENGYDLAEWVLEIDEGNISITKFYEKKITGMKATGYMDRLY